MKSVEEEWRRIDYYKLCTLGGMFSAGTTHLLITPLDVLKVNMQVPPPLSCCMYMCVGVCISAFQ